MSEWLQVNVALARPAGEDCALANARALFAAFRPAIDDWRRRRQVTCFYFMRKAPDVRLRFRGPAAREAIGRPAQGLLRGLQHDGVVERWWKSAYEPEFRKFGGRGAMAGIHGWFDSDTRNWLMFDELVQRRATSVSPARLLVSVADDLFTRAVADREEIWDVWCNLVSYLPSFTAPSIDRTLLDGAGMDELLASRRPERGIAANYCRANILLADRLHREWSYGRLSTGIRALLPHVTQYSFHRWGLDPTTQSRIARTMAETWDPHAGLRGATP